MSKLSIDQKTIEGLFSDKKTDFLILVLTVVRVEGFQ